MRESHDHGPVLKPSGPDVFLSFQWFGFAERFWKGFSTPLPPCVVTRFLQGNHEYADETGHTKATTLHPGRSLSGPSTARITKTWLGLQRLLQFTVIDPRHQPPPVPWLRGQESDVTSSTAATLMHAWGAQTTLGVEGLTPHCSLVPQELF